MDKYAVNERRTIWTPIRIMVAIAVCIVVFIAGGMFWPGTPSGVTTEQLQAELLQQSQEAINAENTDRAKDLLEAVVMLEPESAEGAQAQRLLNSLGASPSAMPEGPAETSVPASTPTPTIHIVQAGDTLASIATKYGISVKYIEQVNELSSSNKLEVGQEVIIPLVSAELAAPAVTATPAVHIVQEGETLISIATRYGGSPVDIQQVNGLSDSDRLVIGQQLIIPQVSAELVAPAVTATPTIHIVQERETLITIAAKYGVNPVGIQQANELSSSEQLVVGQKLLIPQVPAKLITSAAATPTKKPTAPLAPTATPTKKPTAPLTPAATPTPTIHVVQAGESLASIAAAYGVTYQKILKANGLGDSTLINVGQELIIPVGQ